ncbi:hypothetical protein CF326_g9005 [Tilletia indica]|nr:hypothetical protein CF326_g9005 [Tilletia indica]
MIARGVKAHLPLDRSDTTTVEDTHGDGAGQQDEGRVGRDDAKTGSGSEGPSRRRDDDRRPPSEGQGPDGARDRTDSSSDGKTSYTAGKIRSATWRVCEAEGIARTVQAQGDSVRSVKARRTPGAAQTVRRGGKTTAGDLPSKLKGRSARNKVRDVFETAWPVRPDEDDVQLIGRWTVND